LDRILHGNWFVGPNVAECEKQLQSPQPELLETRRLGDDEQQLAMFSYVSPEQRIPQDHPLRPMRTMANQALRETTTGYSDAHCAC
jgi:hypothetical protein